MIYDVVQKLKAEGSSKAKIQILKDNESDLLKRVLLATYDYRVTYGIKQIPQYDFRYTVPIQTLDCALDLLIEFGKRKITGNAASDALANMLYSLNRGDAEVVKLVIARDLGCGISTKTINKAFPDLIPIFELMACEKLNSKTEKHLKFPCYAQLKYDAARVCVIVKSGLVTYYTRNGSVYQLSNKQLDDVFINASCGYNMVYDGELYQLGADGKPEPRTISNGVANKLIHGTATEEQQQKAMISLWDVVPLASFELGLYDMGYEGRYDEILKCFPEAFHPETHICNTLEEVKELGRSYITQGQEGIIAKNMDGIWERKRVFDCLKVKQEIVSDMLIIGMEEGTGKNAGRLGNLIVQSSCGKVITGVGIFKGMDESIRDDLWKNSPVGKIAAVLHNGIVTGKDGTHSIFLPRVIELRFDKTEADDYQKILDGV